MQGALLPLLEETANKEGEVFMEIVGANGDAWNLEGDIN